MLLGRRLLMLVCHWRVTRIALVPDLRNRQATAAGAARSWLRPRRLYAYQPDRRALQGGNKRGAEEAAASLRWLVARLLASASLSLRDLRPSTCIQYSTIYEDAAREELTN